MATWQRCWLAVGLLTFAATRSVSLFASLANHSDVNFYFHSYIEPTFDQGGRVYRDVAVHYPPVAWAFIALPRLVDSDAPPGLAGDELKAFRRLHYHRAFRGAMLICDLAALALFWSIVRRRRPDRSGILLAAYAGTTGTLAGLLYERLDLGLLLLFLGWTFAWLRSLDANRRVTVWWLVSYGLLALGINFKVVPILMVPFLLLAEWNTGRWSRLLPAVAMLVIVGGLPFALLYPTAGTAPFHLFRFHGERGIQVESVYGSLLELAACFGWRVKVELSHGAYDLQGALAPIMSIVAKISMGALLGGTGLWALSQGRRFDRTRAILCAWFVVVAAVGLTNVLSPQYFMWALPLSLLVAAEVLAPRLRDWVILSVAVMAVGGLTMLVCPFLYSWLISARPPMDDAGLVWLAVVAVAARNAVYLSLACWLGVGLVRFVRGQADLAPWSPS